MRISDWSSDVCSSDLSENGRRVAAMDLCGNGRFTLLTGISGAAWEQAAAEAAAAFGIEIAVHRIGPGQRYDDPYGDFAAASEVADDGALLVRPDKIGRAHV